MDELTVKLDQLQNLTNTYGYGDLYVYGHDEANATQLEWDLPVMQTVSESGAKLFYAVNWDGRGVPYASLTGAAVIDQQGTATAYNTTLHNLYQASNPNTKLLVYDWPQGGVEDFNIYRQRLGYMLYTSGYDGTMDFGYQHQYGQSAWNDYDSGSSQFRDHNMIYPTSDGVIDTVQWEAVRQAVDDVRYAGALNAFKGSNTTSLQIINAGLTAGTDPSIIRTNIINQILPLVGTDGSAPVSHFYMNLTTTPSAVVYGAESFNTTGLTIGGGGGYSDTITSGDYTVTSIATLGTALNSSHAGDVIYINPSSTLDLSGYPALTIPSGVTLASNRGVGGSTGALIKKTTGGGTWGWEQPMFKTTGVDVRVTGLQLEGEMLAQDGTGPGESRYLVGLEAETATNFEVDNCELRGWSWSAISLDRSSNSYIHNNYIHHNQAAGEGYGTSLYEGTAIVERNLYSYNRHDITGDGNGNEQYTFRYNIDLGTGSASGGSRTDVHEGTGGYAGSTFNISYNSFKASGDDQLLLPIQISEKPLVDMTISHNIFEGSTIMGGGYYTAPVRQLVDVTFGNLTVSDNYWKDTLYPTNTSIVMYEVR
jgi:hypothetical protein